MADKPSNSIQLKLSLEDDYSAYMQEFQLLPQKKGEAVECFRISYLKPQTQVRKTKLQLNDCLLVIKSYKLDPMTKARSDYPEIVTLNNVEAASSLMTTLKTPYKVELEFLREKKLFHWIYELEYN